MSYEISKFPFKAELASASFNAKFEEIETYLNNLSSQIQTLTQQLENKAEKNIIGIKKIDDALEVNNSGMFWCAGSQNAPEENGLLINTIPWTDDLGYKTLIFVSSMTGKIYTRYKWANTWSPNWVEK